MIRREERGDVRIQGNGLWMTFARWGLISTAFVAFGWKANGMWRDVLDEIRGLRADLGTINVKFQTEIHRLDQRVGRIEDGKEK